MPKKKTKKEIPNEVKALVQTIEKQFGKGAVFYGDKGNFPDVETMSSGCMSLDKALGGGWAQGRIIEIYGPNSSGKTTLTLHAIAQAQREGKTCAFVDVEHALDPHYATNLGVDISELLISQPESGEEALQIVEMLIMSGIVSMIVVDSVSALLPRAEIEKEIGDATVGRQAGLMSQAMRKLTGKASKAKCTVFFINQIRMKIGVMFGNPETTSGGEALKYYSSQRVEVRRGKPVKNGDDVVAAETKVKIVKNKIAPPFKQAEFKIRFGTGIDVVDDVLAQAINEEIIKKAGAWYSYNDENIGQGSENTRQYLIEHPELYEELWRRLQSPEVVDVSEPLKVVS